MENKNNWLAKIFMSWREVIEAAETPMAKLAVFVLPAVAPLIPAFFTSAHIFSLIVEIFVDVPYIKIVAVIVAGLTGLVLEMLGFAGAIEFIKSIWKWIKHRSDEYVVPVILNGVAYIFYLIAMFLINVQLGKYFGTPPIINSVIGLLSFLTVPTGLIAASHLSIKDDEEREDKLRQEMREDKLKGKAIKAGFNPFDTTVNQQVVDVAKEKVAGDYKAQAIEYLDELWGAENRVATPRELTTFINKKYRVSLDHSKCKGTWSNFTKLWKASRGL